MSIRLFTIQGYGHLYRSLLRFCKICPAEVRELLYTLNTANLDSYAATHPRGRYAESGPARFLEKLKDDYQPYRTEAQLYKAMAALDANILYSATTGGQQEAVRRMRRLMCELNTAFHGAFGMEIDDPRTVYSRCVYGLVPRGTEPCLCLLADWLDLTGA